MKYIRPTRKDYLILCILYSPNAFPIDVVITIDTPILKQPNIT